jgi:hypothetical protein
MFQSLNDEKTEKKDLVDHILTIKKKFLFLFEWVCLKKKSLKEMVVLSFKHARKIKRTNEVLRI